MNYAINTFGKWYKQNALITIPVSVGLVLCLALFVWYRGTVLWNGAGNLWFAAKVSWQGRKLESELNSATEQKKELEQTLIDFAKSKEALAAARKESEIQEQIFNDKTTTSAEKVKAFQAAMQSTPVHTDPSGVTVDDLCARAKALNSSAATIAALCR